MRRAENYHQRVIVTRWWWRWSSKGREGQERPPTRHEVSLVVVVVEESRKLPPTSHDDSLVVEVVVEVVVEGQGGLRTTTNETRSLVGAHQ